MNYSAGIGLPNLPQIQKTRIHSSGCRLNIMLVGSHGIGKTTFLNSFFKTAIFNFTPSFTDADEKYPFMSFPYNVQITDARVVENSFVAKITTIEVDGVGDAVSNKNTPHQIADLIKQRYEDYSRNFTSFKQFSLEDRRVHLCLYFLEPSLVIREVDIECMHQISACCNLIPVISKCDFVSKKALIKIKSEIRSQLDAKNIATFQGCPPYAIVLSSGTGPEEADLRVYPWGEICVSSLYSNEFLGLRSFILRESIAAVYEETDNFYDKFRILKLSGILIQSKGKGECGITETIEQKQREVNEIKERIKKKKALLKRKGIKQ